MKQLVVVLFAVLCSTANAGEKVLERPAFKSETTSDIFPMKVELTKEATIVHFHVSCAAWRDWSVAANPRLEADGKTFACQKGRIITHEGKEVLADEAFEFEKEYEKDARKDSVILYFDPLPKGTKTFDFIENDDDGMWKFYGIRLDNKLYPELLPAYKLRKDDGKPLEPLTLKYGEATATITILGDTINDFSWFGDPSRDPITSEYNVKSEGRGNLCCYFQPAYSAIMPKFIGPKIDTDGFGGQYNMIVIPGETLTIDFDPATCYAMVYDFAAGKPSHQGYRLGGTIGDLNEVLLDNQRHFVLYKMSEIPTYNEVKDFPEWREKLWQNLCTVRDSVMNRQDYTRRQKDFFTLLIERAYVRCNVFCLGFLEWNNNYSLPDSALAHLRNTYTLVDPHAKELQFFQDGRSFYFPLVDVVLPYFEANGLTESEPYRMTKAMVEAKKIGDVMKQGKILPESEIGKAHPYFQRVLREFNDSNRVQLERIEREAKDRMKPTPDVPGDKLLQAIVDEHPGKVVFFDLWATWCGPCKRGIEAMEPLKEKLKGKDVVFVYITDESSFMNAWTESVLKIPGIHYRLATKKWEEIPIPGGIPQYYLYDRQGKKVWEQTGFDDEVLKDIEAQINKALE